MRINPFLDTDNGEKSQAKTVKNKQRNAEVFLNGFKNHRKNRGDENKRAHPEIVNPEYRHIDQKIADGTAAHRRGKRHCKYAKRIQPLLHSRKTRRHGKGNNPQDFYNEIKLFVH